MSEQTIAIIGAGPASLYAAEALAKAGRRVVIFNRDIKPGGLAEFGIYPNKYKMKGGLRKMFDKILSDERITYFGNVAVGAGGAFGLDDLRAWGFDAILVAVGAQGTKWLGLPGEDATGVYHAKDVVYHYNCLPPFAEREYQIGQQVCVVGLGNVALDIAHWLICERKVAAVTAVARRGPGEAAYTDKEMKIVGPALDRDHVDGEFASIAPVLEAVGQDPAALKAELLAYKDGELETDSPTKLHLRYLRSPQRIETDAQGRVSGLTCEITRLTAKPDGSIGTAMTGETEMLPCDTVIFAIGDAIEPSICLPIDTKRNVFATVPQPWPAHPERPRYMVYDPAKAEPVWGTFVAGWSRKASDGLVGKARADALQGSEEILAWLDGQFEVKPPASRPLAEMLAAVQQRFAAGGIQAVSYRDVRKLVAMEERIAAQSGLPEFKYKSNEQMLQLIGSDELVGAQG